MLSRMLKIKFLGCCRVEETNHKKGVMRVENAEENLAERRDAPNAEENLAERRDAPNAEENLAEKDAVELSN